MTTIDVGGQPAGHFNPTTVLPSLSIVLPCYDEAPNVVAAVSDADVAGSRFATEHEIIVVDDGSRDRTRAIADSIALLNPRVRVVGHENNRGYGAAVRSGIEASGSEWVLLTDADLQFDLSELRLLLPLAADHDLVAGYRIDRADPVARRLAAHAWNRLMRLTFRVGVRDVDCAFKLVRGSAVRALDLESDGAMISTELVVRAQLAGWRIAEAGVHHRPREAGEPTGGDVRVVAQAFRERRALIRRLRGGDVRSRPATGHPQPAAR
ncbi:MAG TPA: glycosyltransferase family 2 protein [Solirubrobacteraceae bacterium]|jgi:glycosyltransferase involved in cell wall biosynthesis